jgi:hypothetical protein
MGLDWLAYTINDKNFAVWIRAKTTTGQNSRFSNVELRINLNLMVDFFVIHLLELFQIYERHYPHEVGN